MMVIRNNIKKGDLVVDYKEIDSYNAIQLNEYNGVFEVVGGNASDGKFYMRWTIASEYNSERGHSEPVKKDNGQWRNVPVKVVIGEHEEAIANLKWLIKQIRDSVTVPAPPDETQDTQQSEPNNVPPNEIDVPF